MMRVGPKMWKKAWEYKISAMSHFIFDLSITFTSVNTFLLMSKIYSIFVTHIQNAIEWNFSNILTFLWGFFCAHLKRFFASFMVLGEANVDPTSEQYSLIDQNVLWKKFGLEEKEELFSKSEVYSYVRAHKCIRLVRFKRQ